MSADKRTASQRIEDLERAVMSVFQVSNNMARDLTMIKDAIKLLGQRVEALARCSQNGEQATNERVSQIMKDIQIEELKAKVTELVDEGILVASDAIAEDSFVVGSENEHAAADGTPGKVVNPRMQFTLRSIQKELQDKLMGAKVGDLVKFRDDAYLFQVAEVYKIVNPAPPVEAVPAPEVQPAPAEAAAPAEAPAAEQSSSDAAQAATPAATSDQAAGN